MQIESWKKTLVGKQSNLQICIFWNIIFVQQELTIFLLRNLRQLCVIFQHPVKVQ